MNVTVQKGLLIAAVIRADTGTSTTSLSFSWPFDHTLNSKVSHAKLSTRINIGVTAMHGSALN